MKFVCLFLCLRYNSGRGGDGIMVVSCLESREEQVRLKASFCFDSDYCISSRYFIVRVLHVVLLYCSVTG